MIRSFLFTCLAFLALLAPALAQGQVEITADQFVIDEANHKAVFTGNVEVKHPNVTVWAPEVVVGYGVAGISDIKSFEATAKDGITVRLETKDQTATGNKAQFDPGRQTLLLTGDVVVSSGAGTLMGPSLLVDLAKNTSTFTGGEGGRVTGVFGSP